jgi:hypothetical protein
MHCYLTTTQLLNVVKAPDMIEMHMSDDDQLNLVWRYMELMKTVFELLNVILISSIYQN